jgi:hypothetical protein
MKISELNLAGTIAGTEVFPIVQAGETRKVSIADALAGAAPTLQSVLDTGNSATGANAHISVDKFIKVDSSNRLCQLGNIFGSAIATVQNGVSPAAQGLIQLYAPGATSQLNGLNVVNFLMLSTNDLGQSSQISLDTYGDNRKPTMRISTSIPSLQVGASTLTLTNNEIYFSGITISTYLDNKTDGVFQTAFINPSNQKIYTGFELDFAGERYSFGDIGNSNASVLICTPFNAKFNRGLNMQLDDINIKLGDYNTSGNQTILEVDDFNSIIKTTTRGAENGLKLDFINNESFLGNYTVLDNVVKVSNGIVEIYSTNQIYAYSGNAGLQLNSNTNQSLLGDSDIRNNGTYLGVDDNGQYIIASDNLKDVDTGNFSGFGIKIFVNGEQFTIPLHKI